MEERLKQRLIGVLVLTLLAVIFVPLLFDEKTNVAPISRQRIPDFPEDFDDHSISIPEPSTITEKIEKLKDNAKVAAHANKAHLKAWVIQVGSFAKAENAMEFRDKIRREGFVAFVETVHGKEKTLFRVRVGPELRREDADALQQRIQTIFNVTGLVVAYPSR